MQNYDLRAIHDSRNSFYNKATVQIRKHGDKQCPVYYYDQVLPNENGNCSLCDTPFDSEVKTLISYVTEVVTIADGKARVRDIHSSTTLRHIKEFLLQNGFKAESKKQIEKDYMK